MVLHTKYSYLEMFTVISMRLFSLKYVQLLSTSLEGSSPIVGEVILPTVIRDLKQKIAIFSVYKTQRDKWGTLTIL